MYFNSIKEILDLHKLSTYEQQKSIETYWYNLIYTKYDDNNYLVDNTFALFHNKIIRAKKTLDILEKNHIFQESFLQFLIILI